MVRAKSDSGGDCQSFAQVGIPSRHSSSIRWRMNLKPTTRPRMYLEQLAPEDLRQAAIVVATILYRTANHRFLFSNVSPVWIGLFGAVHECVRSLMVAAL